MYFTYLELTSLLYGTKPLFNPNIEVTRIKKKAGVKLKGCISYIFNH